MSNNYPQHDPVADLFNIFAGILQLAFGAVMAICGAAASIVSLILLIMICAAICVPFCLLLAAVL